MPRQKNTRLTTIYWLYDIRPEMVVAFGPEGKPFYCGKTVRSPEHRLRQHRQKGELKMRSRILACGDFIHVKTMEIVPADQDWAEHERSWIRTLRVFHPDCINVSDGGEGTAGLIHSAETRAKMSIALRGKKLSPEHITKRTEGRRGFKQSPEAIAQISAMNRGRKLSPETRARMSAAHRGKKRSPEHIASMIKGWQRLNQTRTP